MRKAFFAALLFVASFAPAGATDRAIWYPQQTTTSTGLNLQNRNERVMFGTWLLQVLGLSGGAGTGVYANISTSAATGLYVTTAPTLASSLGTLYQVQQDDTAMPATCPVAITTCTQLAADPTLIAVPAFQSGTAGPLGPLAAPVTSGQSVYWLIEAQVNPSQDTGSAAMQFVIGQGPSNVFLPQQLTVNVKRTDQIVYATKEGTAGTSPSEPSVDSGYVAIAYVLIPYGTTQVTGGMITSAPVFTGFGGGTVTSVVGANNISAGNVSGTVTVSDSESPTWSGTATANILGATTINQVGTDVSGSWLNYGTLGSATTGMFRFGNSTSGSGYTAIGAGGACTLNGITDVVLGVGNTSVCELALDGSGNLSVLGSLNVANLSAYGLTGSPNQGVVAAVNGNQLAFVNPSIPATLAAPEMVFSAPSSGCADGSTYTIAEFLNGHSPQESPVVIGCSSTITPLSPALNVHGVALVNGSLLESGSSGYIQAGYGSGATLSGGDLGAAETTSCGKVVLGGSVASGSLDYDCTHSAKFSVNAPLISTGAIQGSGFNVGGSTLTPCDICDGTSGTTTNSVLAYGAGTALGYNTLGSTNSALTFGSTVLPGNGLAITNSVAGLIDVFDGAGSLGINGDFRSGHSTAALRSVIGGFATAVAPISSNYGDVEGSRSTTTGNLNLGGTSSSCNLDYGITNTTSLTAACALTSTTHNACSATSNVPCEFTFSVTMSSGTGTATQAVPSGSVCGITPTVTTKISSTNMLAYWATLSSTTLTVHANDQLATDSATFTGNGYCL